MEIARYAVNGWSLQQECRNDTTMGRSLNCIQDAAVTIYLSVRVLVTVWNSGRLNDPAITSTDH